MFTGTPSFLLHPQPLAGRRAASESGIRQDDGPPVQRLTARQIRSLSAAWKARGRAGDETALRVAEALEGVAHRRAAEESRHLRSLAGRICSWIGLGRLARSAKAHAGVRAVPRLR